MTIALALFGYAVAMSTVGAAALERASWPGRAPQLGVLAWLSAMGSVVAAVMLGGFAAATRLHVARTDPDGALRVCLDEWGTAFATPGDVVITTLAVLAFALVAGRVVGGVVTAARGARRQQRRQLQLLGLLAHRDHHLGVLVVDHPTATVYCLPGRRGCVVVSSAALSTLEAGQLAAVLAHEHAHLRGRHHLLVAISKGLVNAFSAVPLFVRGDEQVRDLVEMAADDHACRQYGPSTLARALLALVDQVPPAAALAARGGRTERRLQRLSVNRSRMTPVSYGAAGGVVFAIVGAPLAIAVATALIVVSVNYC
ncbi:M56 family metallopeptidase [Kribbella albertanoniae]|uniref:M56 family peptidase n=1 Tax=Kribbella albertanoniae TaxID=1266829 RepID=A0A4R4QIF6_9ACTN|nr:M56 family metallopeptidase [Kribbella albertanoniae]TDC35002.1 M56 family peptidase [Kribbella albertanoniae]